MQLRLSLETDEAWTKELISNGEWSCGVIASGMSQSVGEIRESLVV